MANGIIPVSWGKELRPSTVNTLDKINEVIHFINQSEIHEFTFSDSGSGESVQTANSTQLMNLTVYGKSVQDGTPTPENPVPVQVVGGRNLFEGTDVNLYLASGALISDNNANSYIAHVSPNTDYTVSYSGGNRANVIGTGATIPAVGVSGSYIKQTSARVSPFTFNSGANDYVLVQLAYNSDTQVTQPQLEAGTQATPYTPYGCIGLQIGETVTPIDLQGHTLAGGDVLKVDSTGRVWIDGGADILTFDGSNMTRWTQQVLNGVNYMRYQPGSTTPFIALNANNSMCNRLPFIQNVSTGIGYSNTNASIRIRYTEDTGATLAQFTEWLQSNPLTLIVPRNEPQTIELGTITPPTILDGSIITINASLTPTIDVKWFTEDTLPEMMNAILGLIKSLHPDDFTASTLDANIVHSIQPIDIQPISDIRPISDIQPIEDIEIMQDENESEE